MILFILNTIKDKKYFSQHANNIIFHLKEWISNLLESSVGWLNSMISSN